MFHRVKSEEQESENTSAQQNNEQGAQEQASAETAEAQESETDTSEDTNLEVETSEPETTQDKPENNFQEKDTETMTDQENATTEQEETTPAAVGSYQRPGHVPVRSAGYPGAYPGLGGSAASESVSDSDRRLTIGPGITMSGEIESCDYLLVEGTVEAALKGANMLEIAESGVFYGTVEINEANIAGRFEGDITVSGRLTITSTGTVTGSISYREIEIEAGAVLDGKLTPLAVAPAAQAKKPAAPKVAKPATPKAADKSGTQPEPANSDEGLFSKATAAAE